jgi:glycosyltransferase involved in cell wall biosynthesis
LTLRAKADVVILHGYFLFWIPIVAAVCLVSGVRYVLTPHGSLTLYQSQFGRGKKRVFELLVGWWVRRGAACLVTGSEAERKEINKQYPATRARVGGVGTTMPTIFAQGPVHQPVRLLSLSRIAPKKRIDLMIEAVAILNKSGNSATLAVAGTGDETLRRNLHDQAIALGISDSVVFLGQLSGDTKSNRLTSSDIFLLPSDDENFGIGLAEALAYGLPSVVSERVAASTAMIPGAGVVLSSPSPATIAAAVTNLIASNQFSTCRQLARTSAERAFRWEVVAARWASILHNHGVAGEEEAR